MEASIGARSARRLANLAATAIAEAFDAHQARFAEITRRARGRFEARDWRGAVTDAVERLDLYGLVIDGVEAQVRQLLGERAHDRLVWAGMRAVYSGLMEGRPDWEVGETFFSSVTRRIFATVGVDPNIEFVDTDFETPPAGEAHHVALTYRSLGDTAELVERVLSDGWYAAPFADLSRDARRVADRLEAAAGQVEAIELVRAPFFRRKGAYLIGRVMSPSGALPLVLALLNEPAGIAVDAVLTDEDDVSVVFGFTRSHFHVDVGPPYELVRFLKTLMPRKRLAELYIAIGFHKHGKTELYRDLLAHLRSTDDRFELAAGTPGLVMIVFTMPGYDVVVKIIRDRFPPSKSVTRRQVMRQYRLVFRHDRAGRLVEAQEFEHLKFDRARFTEELLVELGREAAGTVQIGEEDVVVHHAYVERRVTPLDVYVRVAGDEAARVATADFGQAIKDLAATDVFPGDLLPKNFGVTRHGRVVCYDYDELSLLTDLSFRDMPISDSYDDELSDEAWFGAGPRDVFPEEFPRFISLPPELKEALEVSHRDLYERSFWTEMQERIRAGELVDIFPYRPDRRLA
jgi:isocitrate dehydrogenase kinase/phosphatase